MADLICPLGRKAVDGDALFVTSDIHAFHPKIITEYGGRFRKYPTLEAMREGIAQAWHDGGIGCDDAVFILGDIFVDFKMSTTSDVSAHIGFLDSLPTKNLYLVRGNHDHINRWPDELKSMFKSVYPMFEVFVKSNVRVVMAHYPLVEWNKSRWNKVGTPASINLHGHVHGRSSLRMAFSMDVGVDAIGPTPIRISEAVQLLKYGTPDF